MRVIKTKHFPFGGYKAINLFGIIFTKGELSNKNLIMKLFIQNK